MHMWIPAPAKKKYPKDKNPVIDKKYIVYFTYFKVLPLIIQEKRT